MAASGSRSIASSLTLGVVLSVCALVASAALIHERLATWATQTSDDEHARAITEAMATQFRSDGPANKISLQRACDLFAEHPRVAAVAIHDQTGHLTAASVVSSELLALVTSPPPLGASTSNQHVVRLPGGEGDHGQDIRRVDVLLGKHFRSERPARLTVLVRTSSSSTSAATRIGQFAVPLAAVGLAVVILTIFWLRAQVVTPLHSLLSAVREGRVGDARVSPTARQDELGEIARSVLELHSNATNWQERANRIERSLDSRVADETRRIHGDMKKIERESWVDPLTGVQNRRMMDEKFGAIFDAQRRVQGDLSVVMMDIDNFKTLNDTLGHGAGDELLKFTGELIRQCLRNDDSAVRYGGDEFLLILPGVAVEQAQSVAGRIIALFAQRTKVLQVQPVPSMSAGVASQANNEPNSASEIVEQADRALYEAKQSGKNTVRICQNIEKLAPMGG